MVNENNLFKCLVYNGGVSLTLIDGGEFCAEAMRLHGFTGETAEVFAAALLGCAFFSAGLKEQSGEVSAVLKTDGIVSSATVSGNANLRVRGCLDRNASAQSNGLFGKSGFMQIVRDDGYSRPFVGACELVYPPYAAEQHGKDSQEETTNDADGTNDANYAAVFFAANFRQYFALSEQLPTVFELIVDQKECKYYAAVLQTLPGCETDWQESANARLKECLRSWISGKADAFNSAEATFGETSCKENRRVTYACNCSREYLKGVLSSLGKEEIQTILREDGAIKVHCHYCNKDYAFVREDLQEFL